MATLIDQGADFATAFLGTLRSGAMVVPLDPTHHDAVLRELVRDADIEVILAHDQTVALALRLNRPVVTVDALLPLDDWQDPPINALTPATLFYTSGSTGRPKGVVDSHGAILENIRRYVDSLYIGCEDRLSLIHGPMFSGLVSSLLSALLTGAAVVPFDLRRSGLDGLARTIVRRELTMLHCVPSILRGLAHAKQTFPDVRVVRLEGDLATWSDVELFRRWFPADATLVNGLGATETGLTRQYFVGARDPVISRGPLPIGYPVDGVTIELRDASGRPVPAGEVGRMAIRSRHLALGYWRDPERTSAAFVAEPEDPAVRTFLSGDLGRMDADGRLVHVGRIDEVWKVRGMAVDTTVIESALVATAGIAEAAAIVRATDDAEARLVAYVVPAEGAEPDPLVIRRDLSDALPPEYVPSAIVMLPSLPTTSTGKVDRSALPAPERVRPRLQSPYRPPDDPLEEQLVRAWSEVLDIRPIGVDDAFFDLGGDSLAADMMLLEVGAALGVDVPRQVLGRAATVAELASELRRQDAGKADELVTLNPGRGPAIFAIHAAVAQPLFYRSVAARLGEGIVFHSLGPTEPGFDKRHGSIEAVAEHYVGRIRRQQPEGPYHLVGFCYGGLIAHQVALNLRGQGAEISSLTLLGVGPLEFPTLIPPNVRRRYARSRARDRLRSGVGDIRTHGLPTGLSMGIRRSIGLLRRSAFRLAARRQGSLSLGALRDGAPLRDIQVARHRATPYPGRVTVVLGRDARPRYLRDPARELAGLADGGVDVVLLPGDEHAMLTNPVANDLAAVLRQHVSSSPSGRQAPSESDVRGSPA